MAAAVEGDQAALQQVACDPALQALALSNRLGPALALEVTTQGVFRDALRTNAARWLLVEQALASLHRLFDATFQWMVFKGADVGRRFYSVREARVLVDLDILISRDDLGEAVGRMLEDGWRLTSSPHHGAGTYNVKLTREILVELHFHLWGWLPRSSAGRFLATGTKSEPASNISPSKGAAFVLAACHYWQYARPRPLGGLVDLVRIAEALKEADLEEVHSIARHLGVQFPVAAAVESAQRVWPRTQLGVIQGSLLSGLRGPEVHFMRRPKEVSLGCLVALRFVSLRRSRKNLLTRIGEIAAIPSKVLWALK